MDLDPVRVDEPSFAISGDTGSCLDFWDLATTSPGDVSPCDAANGRNGYPGVYFLPSLVGNPNVSGDLLSGLANDLIIEAVPFACSGPGCETQRLRVQEKGGVYATSWSVNKKDDNLAETYWRVRVALDTGEGGDPVPLAYRDIFLTNFPSSDQPANGPTLDIQFGSNQTIKVFIERNACANVEEGISVSCLIGDEGGPLGLITPLGQQIQVNIGPGNGARSYTLTSTDGAVDVDLRKLGSDFTVIADPPFPPDYRLNASDVRVCEPSDFDTSGGNDAFIVQQDAYGQSVLPRFEVSCPLFPTSVGLFDRIKQPFGSLASLFAPQPLIATSAVKAGSGGGGTLQRLSSFVLAEAVALEDATSPGALTIEQGQTITLSARARVNDGSVASGATVRFFVEDGDLISCTDSSSGTSCVETTDADGLASVIWTPIAGDRRAFALGCGIAVPGLDTPPTDGDGDGILGVLQPGVCDRDPFVVDGYVATVDGYANGAESGVDPFEPFGSPEPLEIAINDLPVVYEATVTEPCDNTGESTVTCSFTNSRGGSLTIYDGTTAVQLNIGPGNGNRAYTLAFNDDAVDVDVRTYGRAVSVTADPQFAEADRLLASDILFCRTFDTSGGNDAFVIQQDPFGQSVLPPVSVSCPLPGTTSSSLPARIGDGLLAAASWLSPQPLIATSALKAGSGGGGTLQRLSDFDLAEMSAMTINSGGGPNTITVGESVDASVQVRVNDGSAASGATVRFFAESGDALVCSGGTPAIAGPAGTTTCVELTGTDGLASVTWTPGSVGSARLFALGCGIAVPGEDTPATDSDGDGILGVLQSGVGGVCDRDPFVVDGYHPTVDGYANGAESGVDPFEPFGTPLQEIAINDLPIVFTATVEAPYTVIEGRSGATDGFGARFRSFGNRGDTELWLGVSDLESGADRVEADVVWLTDSTVGDGILLSYDPAGAPGGQLLAQVTVPGGDDVSLTYDNVAGNAPAACPASDVDVLVVEIVGRHKGTLIDLRNVVVNGIPIEPSSFSGTRGTFNWTIAGFDVTSAFTVSGELFLSGEFPPNGDALTKLQISAACLP
jgi:hypothetical protein